jgi:nicotinamidase-related amidase
MPIASFKRTQSCVLLIDAQPLFWEKMIGPKEPVLARIEHLLMLAEWSKIPVIATFEEPVEKKGMLPERLERVFPGHGQRLYKRTYNCCAEPHIREAIKQLAVRQMVVAGAETDVCILQSVLNLLRMKYQVFLLEDCLFTTEPYSRPALERMYQAGAVPSTFKMMAYELTGSVDETPWLEYVRPISSTFPKNFRRPEALPPFGIEV